MFHLFGAWSPVVESEFSLWGLVRVLEFAILVLDDEMRWRTSEHTATRPRAQDTTKNKPRKPKVKNTKPRKPKVNQQKTALTT